MGLFKRSTKGQSASRRGTKPPQPKTFILEPILTPSGLVAGEDPDHPAALVDLVNHPAVDLGMTSTEMHPVIDSTDTEGDRVHPIEDLALQNSVSDTIAIPHTDIQPLAFVGHPIDELPSTSTSPFTSGVFTVGESGSVSVDYLYDGGGYKGELAFFSLEGMDQFTPGSQEFIHEAAHRALSDSDLGHIVIRDAGEGAKFSADVTVRERNFNQGAYLGEKVVHMAPGSKFGVMLVPNGTVQEVYDKSILSANKHPLFSLASANPQHQMQLGQIGDVTGDGHTFAMEDLRLDQKSDRDYNDIVFHVKGATGQAETLDSMIIDHRQDWRSSDMGHQLIEYVTQSDTTLEPGTGGEVPTDSGQGSGGGTPAVEGTGSGGSYSNGGSQTPSNPDPGNSGQPTTGTETSGGSGSGTSSGSGSSTAPSTPGTVILPGSGTSTGGGQLPNSGNSSLQQPLIGIIDTGFSSHNPDINYDRILLGYDYVDWDSNPLVPGGSGTQHGTEILNIIAATKNNGIGIDGIDNQSPIWVSRAVGSTYWADALIDFVDAAKAQGRSHAVVNLSFDLMQINLDGSISTRHALTIEELDALNYARANNVLIVAAAGNEPGQMSALGMAALDFDNILVVGAADGFHQADYSGAGITLDVVAPGTMGHSPTAIDRPISGTSVAAAQVTGSVAQVWQANPELSYHQVMDVLRSTAADLEVPGWDGETGWGMINLEAAVKSATSTITSVDDRPLSNALGWNIARANAYVSSQFGGRLERQFRRLRQNLS
jgi:hypothetical protein